MILQKLKNDAESYLGESGRQKRSSRFLRILTILSVRRRRMPDGLPDLRCSGSSMSRRRPPWPMDWITKRQQKIMVYDLGGGTFDVSIIEIGRRRSRSVIATSGDNHLGGDDFDERIARLSDRANLRNRRAYRPFQGSGGVPADPGGGGAGEEGAVLCVQRGSINLPFIAMDEEGGKHLALTLTRIVVR